MGCCFEGLLKHPNGDHQQCCQEGLICWKMLCAVPCAEGDAIRCVLCNMISIPKYVLCKLM